MNERIRAGLYVALLLVWVLHNDLWLWDDPGLVLGLPIGLVYHVGYTVVVSSLMFVLARWAWPTRLEVDEEGRSR